LEPETKPSSSARISSGLVYLRRIRASVSHLFSWLWSNLRSLFQEIKTSIRNQDNTDEKRTESQNKGLNAVPPKPDSPPAPPKEKYSRKKCRNCLDIARFVVEVFGLVGLIVYAVLTYFMYCENRDAADAAKSAAKTAGKQLDAFKNTERAILYMDATWDSSTQKITYTLKNIGNGTAHDISVFGGGGICPITGTGKTSVEVPQTVWENVVRPIHSDVGGFPLEAHGKPWSDSDDAAVPQDGYKSGEPSFYKFRSIGYKDQFGDEWFTYACMFYQPIRHRMERCPIPTK
jgi:hypothetical protein